MNRVSVRSVRLPEGSLVAYSGAIGSNTPPQLATRGLTMPGVAGQGSGSRLACACCRVWMVLGCHMIFGVEWNKDSAGDIKGSGGLWLTGWSQSGCTGCLWVLLGVMRLLGTRSLVVGVAVASLVCPGARLGSGIGTWITEWAGAVRGGLIWGSGMHTGAVSRGRLVAGVWQDGRCKMGRFLTLNTILGRELQLG